MEEYRLKVFDNTVFRRIFGSKKLKYDDVGNCIMGEFQNLYSSPDVIRMIKSRIFEIDDSF
jgi:hypothetical protein